MKSIFHYSITAAFAVVGALLFNVLHIPMPWLLGPVFMTMILRFTTTLPIKWHKQLRNTGLVLAGYSIGTAFTVHAFGQMTQFLPAMVVLNIFYVVLFWVISQLIVARTNVDPLAAFTSTVPGGMTQVLSYAAEKGSRHLTMITFYQVLRVLCILSLVPLIVSTAADVVVESPPFEPVLALYFIAAFIAGIVAQKCKVPTGYMLGPLILLIVLQLVGLTVPALPISLLHVAQLLIGVFIGMLLKKEDVRLPRKLIFYGFISSTIYIGTSYVASFGLVQLYDIDVKTAFLSIVPGGLDQMGLIAASVQADVTVVTAFQLFRVLVVSLLIIPSLKYFINREKTVQ